MEFSKRIKSFWEDDAGRYSANVRRELAGPNRDVWVRLVLDYAPQKEKMDILDVGTGPGFFPIVLTQAGHTVTGTDITENMIACAMHNLAEHNVTATMLTMDTHMLSFSEGSFDLIVCRNLTWTLENPEKAYAEWKRVLRPGGRALIFDACWYLHLQSVELTRDYQRKLREIDAVYGENPNRGHYDAQELDELSKKLFMSDKLRPQWDLNVLLALGFSKVFTDVNIGGRFTDEGRQRAMRQLHQPFVIGAEK